MSPETAAQDDGGNTLCKITHCEQQLLWPRAVVQRGSLEGCMYKQQFSIQTETHLIARYNSQSRSVRSIPGGGEKKLLSSQTGCLFSGLFFSDCADSVSLGCILELIVAFSLISLK